MKAIIAARFNMIGACISTAEDHSADWQGLGGFSIPFSRIKDVLMPQLVSAIADGTEGTSPATLAKSESRKKLEGDILHLSLAIADHGSTIGDNQMAARVAVTASDLRNASDAALIGIATKRLLLARELPAEALGIWNIIKEVLDGFERNVATYAKMYDHPRDSRRSIRDANHTAVRLIDEITALMVDKLDGAVRLLAANAPSFANKWKMARKLRKPANRTRSLELAVVDAETGKALEKAQLSINDLGISRDLNGSGTAWIQNLKEGHYIANVNRSGYKPTTVEFDIAGGETSKVKVEMEREI